MSLNWSDWTSDATSSDNIDIQGGTFTLADAIPDSGLVHNYDAQAISASDGQTLSAWADSESTNDWGGGSPIYRASGLNGLPVVEWDGTDDAMTASPISHGTTTNTYTYHVVYNWGGSDTELIFATGDGSGGINPRTQSGNIAVGINGIEANDSGVASPTSPCVVSVKSDGSNHHLLLDGTDHGTFSQTDPNSAANGAQLAQHWDGSGSWQGDIAQILWYDITQSDTKFTDAHSELRERWGFV